MRVVLSWTGHLCGCSTIGRKSAPLVELVVGPHGPAKSSPCNIAHNGLTKPCWSTPRSGLTGRLVPMAGRSLNESAGVEIFQRVDEGFEKTGGLESGRLDGWMSYGWHLASPPAIDGPCRGTVKCYRRFHVVH
jgi:hypothetical protein